MTATMRISQALHRCHGDRSSRPFAVLLVAVLAVASATEITSWQSGLEEDGYMNRKFREPRTVTECGGVYSESVDQITSPNYPMLYPNNAHCVYRISAPDGKSIWIQFITLELEQSKECESDVIEIYDGVSDDGPLLRTLCGFQNSLPAVTANSSDAYIVFKTDGIGTAKGFKLEYFIFDWNESGDQRNNTYTICDDVTAMASNGVLLSHRGYPSNEYPSHSFCKVLIPPRPGFDGVKIEFFDVKLKVFTDECSEEGEQIVVYKTFHREHLVICRNEWRKLSFLVPGDSDFPVLMSFQTTVHTEQSFRGFKAIYTQYYRDDKYGGKSCRHRDFHCSVSGLCIPESAVCDGLNHCGDFQDERNCGQDFLIPPPEEICNPEEFYCGVYGSGSCVYRQYALCDGWKDCKDGSDEFGCPEMPKVVSGETIVGILIGIVLAGFFLALIAMWIYKRVEKTRERAKRMKKPAAEKDPQPTAV
ncbi:low-density lipoprotein receptor-related protein 12-like isoform X2 [Ptychodera flava]|uniref:low-density lipoprotein receptor-related protein 12-like isoform X2 n=1 Tax=Ptychodera flava TaxID=63121 RepID=UPI00396A916D